MAHLNFETILNYVEGSLSLEARSGVEAHLNQPCLHCQALAARVTDLLHLMANDNTIAPPRAVVQRMLAVIHRHAATDRPRIPATLVFDSWQHDPLLAMRGPESALHQQLLFRAEGLDIDLQLTSSQDDTTVRGQILSAGQDEVLLAPVVVLHSRGDVVAATETDRLGQFAFESVPSGIYDLHIELERADIAIEGIRLDR